MQFFPRKWMVSWRWDMWVLQEGKYRHRGQAPGRDGSFKPEAERPERGQDFAYFKRQVNQPDPTVRIKQQCDRKF